MKEKPLRLRDLVRLNSRRMARGLSAITVRPHFANNLKLADKQIPIVKEAEEYHITFPNAGGSAKKWMTAAKAAGQLATIEQILDHMVFRYGPNWPVPDGPGDSPDGLGMDGEAPQGAEAEAQEHRSHGSKSDGGTGSADNPSSSSFNSPGQSAESKRENDSPQADPNGRDKSDSGHARGGTPTGQGAEPGKPRGNGGLSSDRSSRFQPFSSPQRSRTGTERSESGFGLISGTTSTDRKREKGKVGTRTNNSYAINLGSGGYVPGDEVPIDHQKAMILQIGRQVLELAAKMEIGRFGERSGMNARKLITELASKRCNIPNAYDYERSANCIVLTVDMSGSCSSMSHVCMQVMNTIADVIGREYVAIIPTDNGEPYIHPDYGPPDGMVFGMDKYKWAIASGFIKEYNKMHEANVLRPDNKVVNSLFDGATVSKEQKQKLRGSSYLMPDLTLLLKRLANGSNIGLWIDCTDSDSLYLRTTAQILASFVKRHIFITHMSVCDGVGIDSNTVAYARGTVAPPSKRDPEFCIPTYTMGSITGYGKLVQNLVNAFTRLSTEYTTKKEKMFATYEAME